jgi:uncharacterized membrane protein
MNKNTSFTTETGLVLDRVPAPRHVPFDAPWNWLAAGWRDMWRLPRISLAYGGAFALAAAALILGLWRAGALSLFIAFAGGFLLIGPLVAVGLYEASRRLAQGESVRLSDVASAGLGARGQLAFFGGVLLFVFLLWLQLALLLLMLFLGTTAPPQPNEFLQALLFTPRGLGLLVAGSLAGGVIAALVFAMSAVAVPLLLVSHVDAVSAARASIAAVVRNPKPMALWAALIAVIMAAGFVTLLVGLAIAFPLIGHATWHAYADIYGGSD